MITSSEKLSQEDLSELSRIQKEAQEKFPGIRSLHYFLSEDAFGHDAIYILAVLEEEFLREAKRLGTLRVDLSDFVRLRVMEKLDINRQPYLRLMEAKEMDALLTANENFWREIPVVR
jgi:hypothetical protein